MIVAIVLNQVTDYRINLQQFSLYSSAVRKWLLQPLRSLDMLAPSRDKLVQNLWPCNVNTGLCGSIYFSCPTGQSRKFTTWQCMQGILLRQKLWLCAFYHQSYHECYHRYGYNCSSHQCFSVIPVEILSYSLFLKHHLRLFSRLVL